MDQNPKVEQITKKMDQGRKVVQNPKKFETFQT